MKWKSMMVLAAPGPLLTPPPSSPSDVQNRRAPELINTCHDARFAPHVGADINAG
jgi:hypothetical protein